MSIKGIGVDQIEIARVKRALEKPRFAQRVYTVREQAYLQARGQMSADSAAGLFAAKEAVAKALGTGIGRAGIGWTQIEVTHSQTGAPQIVLCGAAGQRLQKLGASRVHVSISHHQTYAIAFCVIE